MTVEELIKELKKHDQNLPVCLADKLEYRSSDTILAREAVAPRKHDFLRVLILITGEQHDS